MKIDASNARAYIEHCNRLAFLTAKSGEEVYATLRRLEKRMNRVTTDYCNGVVGSEQWDKECARTRVELNKLFPNLPTFVNGDPRGFNLKVAKSHAHLFPVRDWGGYGILAPEF